MSWPFLRRVGPALALIVAIAIAWRGADVRLGGVFSFASAAALWRFLSALFPPDLSPAFLRTVFKAVVQTLATATAATILSVALGLPLGVLASATLWRRGVLVDSRRRGPGFFMLSGLSTLTRAVLGFIRAVPDLLWAILFVTMVGLGSLAGTLALAVTYSGLIGRVYSDAFDSTNPQPLEALQSTGASRFQIFLFGIWPQALPTLTAYTLYSFECAVRSASVLGLVGAGGIGYEIGISLRLFEYGQLLTLILAFVALLAASDIASRRLRAMLNPRRGTVRGDIDTVEADGGSPAIRPTGSRRMPLRTLVRLPVLVAGTWASFYFSGFTPEVLKETDVLKHAARFVGEMFPPEIGLRFVSTLGGLLLQTISISFLGTLVGVCCGVVIAWPATATLIFLDPDGTGHHDVVERSLRWLGFWLARLILNVLRAIPEMVWVLICILVVGVGPFAGTIAIGLHTTGVLGKLYAEVMEEVSRRPLEALSALGARPAQIFLRGVWPQARPMLRNYTLLRWEANLRVSTILGLLGGGGLGQAIYNNIQLGFYDRVGTMVLLIYGLVLLGDAFGNRLRTAAAG